jgi:DmsE family decaheme c-type cytochrome
MIGAAVALFLSTSVAADEIPGSDSDRTVLSSIPETTGEYATGGMDACLKCHDEREKFPVLSILATPHAVMADERTPLSREHACQTCHGPSADHGADRAEGEPRPPVSVAFDPETPSDVQNQVCLTCHAGGDRMSWASSRHALQDVSCASCHEVHAKEDPMLVKNIDPMVFLREGQAQTCFTCHQQQRAEIQHRVSSHPLREGKLECSSCHSPHGSFGPSQLAKPTLNETCYQCHAEKRGPFLWEHAPAREDCSICHTPHGSNHPSLLVTRVPQLCQQCHMAGFHPSTLYDGPDHDIPSSLDRRALDKGCLNCHYEVHGSNHPSGVRWTR